METKEILKEIKKLPVQKRMFIIEQTIKTIRKNDNRKTMYKAAQTLFETYQNDKELTAFTELDCEVFYETR